MYRKKGYYSMMSTFKNWWSRFASSAEEQYLSESTDHGDLENRLRRLEYLRHSSTLCQLNNGGL